MVDQFHVPSNLTGEADLGVVLIIGDQEVVFLLLTPLFCLK